MMNLKNVFKKILMPVATCKWLWVILLIKFIVDFKWLMKKLVVEKIFTGFIWFIISKLFPALNRISDIFSSHRGSITAEDL